MEENKLKEIYKIISLHLGDSAVIMYKNFYKDKDDETILNSFTELLTELTGPINAKKQLTKINKITNLHYV